MEIQRNSTVTADVWKGLTVKPSPTNLVSGPMLLELEPATRVAVYWATRDDPKHPALQDFLLATRRNGSPMTTPVIFGADCVFTRRNTRSRDIWEAVRNVNSYVFHGPARAVSMDVREIVRANLHQVIYNGACSDVIQAVSSTGGFPDHPAIQDFLHEVQVGR